MSVASASCLREVAHSPYDLTRPSDLPRASCDPPPGRRGVAPLPSGWTPQCHPDLNNRFTVPWEDCGDPCATPIVALGGISASRHVTATNQDPSPGWWERQVGAGRALDPANWRIIGMDFLGAGPPLSTRSSVPRLHLTAEDQADALFAILDRLEIERVHAVVGASYGGMVALAAALAQPERVGRLVIVASAHRSHPHANALRIVQRRIVEMGMATNRPQEALAVARALAFTTYRTAGELDDRFSAAPRWGAPGADPTFEVSDYLDARGQSFAKTTDASAFLTLSESIDLCDLDPAGLRVPSVVISFKEDTLVPPWLVDELVENAGAQCEHYPLSSKCGHDGFLMASDDLADALRTSLSPSSFAVSPPRWAPEEVR